MMNLIDQGNKSTPMRIIFIINAIAGSLGTGYTFLELGTNCGLKFVASTLGFFSFLVLNILLLRKNMNWTPILLIAFSVTNLFVFIVNIAFIFETAKLSMCGYQFCITGNINSTDYIQDFKNDSNYTSHCSSSITPDDIASFLQLYSIGFPNIKIDTIYYYYEALSLIALIGTLCLSLILGVYLAICFFRKKKQNSYSQPLMY